MKSFILVLVLFKIVLPLADGWAAAEKGDKSQKTKEKDGREALIKEALELAGVKNQIQQIPVLIQDQIAKRQGETDPKAQATISKIMTEAYQAQEIYQVIENSFKYHFDQKRLSAALEWLRSPLGKKVSGLELKVNDPGRIQELQKFSARLKEKPATKERMALVQRLDDAAGATQFSLHMNLAGFRSLAKAVDATLPPAKRLQEGQLEKLADEMKAKLQGPLRENTLTSFLFTYRSLSDNELKQYVGFAETDHGRWFHRVLTEGFLQAMTAAGEKAFQQIAKAKAEPDTLALPTKSPGRSEAPRYSPVGKPDPFRPWGLTVAAPPRPKETLSPLERYELGQLKLVGVIWNIREPKAMVEDSAGLGYVLRIGTPIGPNEGKVKAIKPSEVVIEERYVDFYGARKSREVSMKLSR